MTRATPVIVFELGVTVPVYHRSTPFERLADEPTERRFRYGVACGRLVRAWGWNPSDRDAEQWEDLRPHTYLRTDHAERIGRPCRQCFPAGTAAAWVASGLRYCTTHHGVIDVDQDECDFRDGHETATGCAPSALLYRAAAA